MASMKRRARSDAGRFVASDEVEAGNPATKSGRPKKKKRTEPVLQTLEVSFTISVGGADVDQGMLQQIESFLRKETMAGKCSLERGGAAFHLHFQGVLRMMSTSVIAVGKLLKKYIGWDENCPVGGVVMCRKLRQNGLHTFVGLVGYCMKDHEQSHFQTVDHNISADDIRSGLMQFSLHGADDKRTRVCLKSKNTFERCAMFWRYHFKRPSLLDIESILYEMIKSGRFYPAMGWVGGGNGKGVPRKKAAALLRAMVAPSLVSRSDIEEIFFSEYCTLSNATPRSDWFMQRWKTKQ